MKLWLDAQLPPGVASWIAERFGIEVWALRDLGLRDATDETIFARARDEDAVLMTKDADFVDLVTRLGPPPRLLWLTCGNVSNLRLRAVLESAMPAALTYLQAGEILVQIDD